MNEHLRFLIANLPASPGVYLMRDKYQKIIYIGKAKNLKTRVSQYFTRPQVGKVQAMVRRTDSFELMITESEKEALILELKLIKTHRPRYNIMLRDDAHYPYIALTKHGDPRLSITRDAKHPQTYFYFGPFPASKSAYDVVRLLDRLFPTKKCKSGSKEPCFYYHLGLCLGYCFREVSEQEKAQVRDAVHTFLSGKDTTTLKQYEARVREESRNLNFEKAQEYQNIVQSIKHVLSEQKIELKTKQDVDVISFAKNNDLLGLLIVSYRRGIRQSQTFEVVSLFGEEEEHLTTLLLQYYEHKLVPPIIIVGSSLIAHNINLVLETKIRVPQSGVYLDLLNNAYVNAKEELSKALIYRQINVSEEELLTNLQTLLQTQYPRQIDLVDIAHLAGSDALGVVATFINGRPFKKLYRKYNVSEHVAGDDYASLSEVLTRHYKRKLSENQHLPDVLFVDGGKGQLSTALSVVQTLKLTFPVFALVKNERHQTRGVLLRNDEEVVLPRNLLSFVASMQEEVHRYAITAHKGKRQKSVYRTVLDDVKGLGAKRQALLLKTYKTLNAMQKAPVSELAQLLPQQVAEDLHELLAKTDL